MKKALFVATALLCCLLCLMAAAEEQTPDFIFELFETEGYNATGSAILDGETLRVTVTLVYDPTLATVDGPSTYTVYINESPAGVLYPTLREEGTERPIVFEGDIPCQEHIGLLSVSPYQGEGNDSYEDYHNSFYLFPTSGMRRYSASARMENGYTVDVLLEERRETSFYVRVDLDWTKSQDDVIRSFILCVNDVPQDFHVTGVWDGEAIGPAKKFMTGVFIEGEPERLQLIPVYVNGGEQWAESIEVSTNATYSTKPSVLGTATVEGASWVHLRSAPTFDGVSLAKIDKGVSVQVTAIEGDWLGVIVGGKTGYMLASLLSPVSE